MTKKIVLAWASMFVCISALAADNAPTAVDWNSMLPSVQLVVKRVFPKETAQAHYPPSITRTADLTGHGASEALVSLGSGSYTDQLTLIRMEGDRPIVARFREGKDENPAPKVFLDGMSEGNGAAVKLMPREHVVYSGHWTLVGAKVKHCGGEAYEWDAESKSFSLNRKLTKSMTKDFCQKVAAGPGKPISDQSPSLIHGQ